jgi:pyruvate ferredoxin oxidoreductase alpha subunit
VASEIKSALYHEEKRPPVVEFITGLGGRDVPVEAFFDMYEKTEAVAQGAPVPPYELTGVRP